MRKQEDPQDDHHHPTMGSSSSSIALLQERFRQLHREKEMREGKKLLRLGEGFTSSKKHLGPWRHSTSSQPSVSSSSSSTSPPRPMAMTLHGCLPKDELDVVPVMQKGYGDDAHHASPETTKSWPTDDGDSSSSRGYSDVDTSLHL